MAAKLGSGVIAQSSKIVPVFGTRKQTGARVSFRNKCQEWERRTVSNGVKTRQMLVWNPFDNKKCETFSYLPPLGDDEIARQVDYITGNGWAACIEFADADQAYVADDSTTRFGSVCSGYHDNRYWTMWKLPMFGCTDPRQVLQEIAACKKAFPNAFSRLVAFDPTRQVQISSFVVNHPNIKPTVKVNSSEVSGNAVRSSTSYSSSSSSSYSYDWNTKTEDKKDSWSQDWNKTVDKKDSWSYDWNTSAADDKKDSWSSNWNTTSAAEDKKDWSYDWNSKAEDTKDSWSYDWNSKAEDTKDSWSYEEKKDYTYDWSTSADTSNSWSHEDKVDYTYDWSKREDSTYTADTNSWSSDWNSSSSSSSYDRGSDIGSELKDVQRQLDNLKTTVEGALDKVSDSPSYSSYSSYSKDYSSSVASLERSWNTDSGVSGKDEKSSAWYSW